LRLLDILFFENTAVGVFIITILLAILAAVIYFAMRHTARYRGFESELLDKVSSRLQRLIESGEGKDHKHVLEQLIGCLPREGQGHLKESLIGDRLLAIQKMRASHAKVNIQALQEMSIAKEAAARGLGFPSFVVGFAMLLGLLGTIIGLTEMAQTIHQTLPTSQDSETLKQALVSVQNVLSSMKSAFAATLAGLICSITASLLNLRLEKAQSRFFEKLERFTIEELLPRTSPSVEDETLLVQVGAQMERYFDELRAVAEQNNHTVQELSAAQKAIGATINGIEQMARSGAAGNVHEVVGQLAGVISELHSTNKCIIDLTTRVPETLEASRRANQTIQQNVTALLDSQKQWQKRLDGSLSGFTQALPDLASRTGQVRPDASRWSDAVVPPSGNGAPHVGAPFSPPETALSQRTFFIYGGGALAFLILVWVLFR
jgi:biopolymer transport protein ExbB/TolQ